MNLLFVILAFLIGLVIKDYLPSYMRKKGENIATKEDIEAITEKVESVKASINFELDREKQFIDKKQQQLLAFYDTVTEFYYELLAVNFGDFPMDTGKSLYEYQMLFYKNVAEILKAYQRLVIFLPPESALLTHANHIADCATQSRRSLKKNFGRIKVTAVEEQFAHMEDDQAKKLEAIAAADEANRIYWEEMKPIVESYRDDLQHFLSEMNAYVMPNHEKA